MAHFEGRPHGPSLSFSSFCCGAEALFVSFVGAVVAPFSVFVFVFVVPVAPFDSPSEPSSHGNALATVS